MKILSLDISSKTGYCLALSSEEGFVVLDHGTLNKVDENKETGYPQSYLDWAEQCSQGIEHIVSTMNPDQIIIEETTASKDNYSQKLLEWIHKHVLDIIIYHKGNLDTVTYYRTGTWRKLTGCRMNDAEKKQNTMIKKIKKETKVRVVKIDGKVVGKVTRKHVSVRRANEEFGLELKLKDNDTAEAMLICYAKHIELIK